MLIVVSCDPETIRPSFITPKDVTSQVCPVNVLLHSPDSGFQILIVSSYDTETIRPSPITHKDATPLVCPVNVISHSPDSGFHILIVPSSDPETIRPFPITRNDVTPLVCPINSASRGPVKNIFVQQFCSVQLFSLHTSRLFQCKRYWKQDLLLSVPCFTF